MSDDRKPVAPQRPFGAHVVLVPYRTWRAELDEDVREILDPDAATMEAAGFEPWLRADSKLGELLIIGFDGNGVQYEVLHDYEPLGRPCPSCGEFVDFSGLAPAQAELSMQGQAPLCSSCSQSHECEPKETL